MDRNKASDYPQALLDLFHEYQHGDISRRAFLDRASKFTVGGLTAAAIFESLKPNYAWAEQVPKNDARLKTEYADVASPQGNGSIKVLTRKGPITGKNELDHYIWRLDSCTVCNACVQVCPFDALEMGHSFENAVYDRRLLIFSLNRYAGPPASVLGAQGDAAVRRQMMEPRGRYDGPVPLNGTAMPVVKPLIDTGAKEGT